MRARSVLAWVVGACAGAALLVPSPAFADPKKGKDKEDTPAGLEEPPPGQDEDPPPGHGGRPPGQDDEKAPGLEKKAEPAPETPAPAAPAAPADPPGNNGTIKIDGLAFDDHPNNEPHPGCSFEVDFYGFDLGDLYATLTFEGIPPTGGGVLAERTVFIGEDPNDGGGSTAGLDASVPVDLSSALASVTPHAKQGWHVKLTVHADGSQGANTKHKVFWVSECTPAPEPEPEPEQTPPGGGTIGTVEEIVPPATDVVVLPQIITGQAATEVAGTRFERSRGALATTGGGADLAPLGVFLVAAGAAAVRSSRRRTIARGDHRADA